MAASNDLVLVVKHTFLEFVSEPAGDATGRSRTRTMSDTCFVLPETPHNVARQRGSKKFMPAQIDEDLMSSNSSTQAGVDSEDESVRMPSAVRSQSTQSRVESWADEQDGQDLLEERTTVMFRNVPNDYSRDALMQMLDDEGFAGQYNFVYLPVDFRTQSGFGYAFVNLVDGKIAAGFMAKFNGFSSWSLPSQKVAEVTWSHPSQGLVIHVERYRNSPVMHESVPDAFKPAMFENGERIVFPPPTKAIRMPRIRHSNKRQ